VKKTALLLLIAVACTSGSRNDLEQAEALIEDGRFREAIAVIEKLDRNGPTSKAHYLLGLCYGHIRDLERMESHFGQALASDSSYAFDIIQAYISIGSEYFSNSQADLGTRLFENVVEISPHQNLEQHFYSMGDYYFATERYDKAIDYYQKGLFFLPDFRRASRAKRNVVQSYHKLGKKVDGLHLCEQYLEGSKNEDLLYEKGKIAYELGLAAYNEDDLDAAVDYLSKTIATGHPLPLQDDVYFLLGEIKMRRRDYAAAKANYEMVLRLNPYGGSQLVADARQRLKTIETAHGE
jgi:tetratricopeptide (TPR) repeat protein